MAGFTMVELLVVVLIIAVLASISFTLFRNLTANAHRATCVGILRQYGVAMNGYLGDHQNQMPYIQVNWQIPFYQQGGEDWHIFAKLYPYLGLEDRSEPTGLPDSLVCPAWRKRFPNWNSDGSGMLASGGKSVYWMNQDQAINGRRIYGTQQGANNPTQPITYAAVLEGTQKTPVSRIPFLADGHHPTESSDPVHGKYRNCLYLDFHVESLPAKDVKLTIAP
jgi:prepilin-type N-terminal cleavage/methylation domain-containing protein/prepilin-type processing-associated H-X9-DG protein